MKKIQIITKNGNETNFKGEDIKLSSLSKPDSFDSFDINFIFLEGIWFNHKSSNSSINYMKDLESLRVIVEKSSTSKTIIVLPKNETFYYNYWDRSFHESIELRNMISEMNKILTHLIGDFFNINIYYENNVTTIGDTELKSSFSFDADRHSKEMLTKSSKSNKITTIERSKIVYTTMRFENTVQIRNFLKRINLLDDKEERPLWMQDIDMFNDEELKTSIKSSEEVIKRQEENINDSKLQLKQNDYYKSILYTQGEELEKVVREICVEMFGFDLSNFVDTKNEDFLYEGEEFSYIGEIKGITSNVKLANVSQLDVHYQTYIDENPNKKGKTIALLIINHQRNKPVSNRESIHEEQIKLATRNGSLIIDSYTFLKMFEKYKLGEISKEKALDIIQTKKGVLLDDDF